MRHAPPADAACASGGWWFHCRVVLHALAAAALAAWAAGHLQSGAAATAAAAVFSALLTALWAARRPRPAGGRLRWDGQCWQFDAGEPGTPPLAGAAEPLLDLGPWLLVRFTPEGGGAARWLAPQAGDGSLQPLRVALYGSIAERAPHTAPGGAD